MKHLLFTLFVWGTAMAAIAQDSAEQLAQAQLEGYNTRNIEAFLAPYAEDVALYSFPQKLQYMGKAEMRKVYTGMFNDLPDLHCTLVNRMVQGDVVIDQESVVFRSGEPPLKAIAIYKIRNGKIAEVYFISER